MADAEDRKWCRSSKDRALLSASLPRTKPLANMVLTTSSVFPTAALVGDDSSSFQAQETHTRNKEMDLNQIAAYHN